MNNFKKAIEPKELKEAYTKIIKNYFKNGALKCYEQDQIKKISTDNKIIFYKASDNCIIPTYYTNNQDYLNNIKLNDYLYK